MADARGGTSRGAITLAAGMGVAAVFGLLFQALLSNYFGAGAETDAFFMSVSIFAFLSKFLMLSQLKSIALPFYQRRQDGGPGLGGLVRLVFMGLAFVTLVLLLAAPLLVRILAPGFDAESAALTTSLLRIRVPALMFTAAITMGLVGLEAGRRFGIAVTASKVVPAVAAFAGLAAIGSRFGITGVAVVGVTSTVAGFGFLWVRWPALFRGSAREAATDPEIRGIGRRWARFSQATLATMAGEWAFRVGASLLPVGQFSAVLYGRRVHDVLHGAVNDSVNTVTLPELSQVALGAESRASQAERDAAVGTRLRGRIEALVCVSLPLAAVGALTAPWIVSVLFGRGRFLADGMSGPTSVALAIFLLGFLVQGINQLCFSAAYATDRSQAVNRVQTVGHVVRALILIPLALTVGFAGLVAGQVFMNVLVLALIAGWWPMGFGLSAAWAVRRLGRISVSALAPCLALAAALQWAGDPQGYSLVNRMLILFALGVVPLLLYGLTARVLGVQLPVVPWRGRRAR